MSRRSRTRPVIASWSPSTGSSCPTTGPPRTPDAAVNCEALNSPAQQDDYEFAQLSRGVPTPTRLSIIEPSRPSPNHSGEQLTSTRRVRGACLAAVFAVLAVLGGVVVTTTPDCADHCQTLTAAPVPQAAPRPSPHRAGGALDPAPGRCHRRQPQRPRPRHRQQRDPRHRRARQRRRQVHPRRHDPRRQDLEADHPARLRAHLHPDDRRPRPRRDADRARRPASPP